MNKLLGKFFKRIKTIITQLKSEAGVTLIELIIAITIIAIIGIVAIPRLMDLPQKARIQAAKMQINNFKLSLSMYNQDNGFFPTTEQGLQALIKKPETEPIPASYNENGYLEAKEVPKDPWGRAYIYTCPGGHGNDYEIMSYGADGQDGGEGKNADIKSWE